MLTDQENNMESIDCNVPVIKLNTYQSISCKNTTQICNMIYLTAVFTFFREILFKRLRLLKTEINLLSKWYTVTEKGPVFNVEFLLPSR